ncbi:uncharacterized protein G2W53_028465 [Senna tora]|uniref:Uncharacterized protein n=1 Tax=Senna tora TaxID=362788 RepID=A0A834T3B1_9FABA|nr:uncharacterized protein G2W53_028465 [Senna tora]
METIMKDTFCDNEEISLDLIKPLLESISKENEVEDDKKLDELLGCKIKVWWPMDEK